MNFFLKMNIYKKNAKIWEIHLASPNLHFLRVSFSQSISSEFCKLQIFKYCFIALRGSIIPWEVQCKHEWRKNSQKAFGIYETDYMNSIYLSFIPACQRTATRSFWWVMNNEKTPLIFMKSRFSKELKLYEQYLRHFSYARILFQSKKFTFF